MEHAAIVEMNLKLFFDAPNFVPILVLINSGEKTLRIPLSFLEKKSIKTALNALKHLKRQCHMLFIARQGAEKVKNENRSP